MYVSIHQKTEDRRRIIFLHNNKIIGIAGYAIVDGKMHRDIGSYQTVSINNILYGVSENIDTEDILEDNAIFEIYINGEVSSRIELIEQLKGK